MLWTLFLLAAAGAGTPDDDAAASCETADGHVALAALAIRERDFARAERHATAALVLDDGLARAHAAAARVDYYTGRPAEADAGFLRAEVLGLREPALLLEHGRALEQLAALERALLVYAEAANVFPADPRPWRRTGALLLDLGRPPDAVRALRRAEELSADDPATLELLGRALAGLGEAVEAEAALGRALALEPDRKDALYALGSLLLQAGREAEGKALLDRFQVVSETADRADHREGQIATFNREGLRLLRDGQALAAVDLFERALALGPRNGRVHANLGLAWLEAGNAEAAAGAFAEAIRRDGDDATLGRLLERARARAASDALSALNP